MQVLFKAMYRTWTAAETVDEEDVRWFYMAKCGDWHLFEVGFICVWQHSGVSVHLIFRSIHCKLIIIPPFMVQEDGQICNIKY